MTMNGENNANTYAVMAGVLLLVADLVGIPSAILSSSLLDSTEWLTLCASYALQLEFSALLCIIMAFSCAGISFALYPILRRQSPALAISTVGFRVMEGIFEIGAAMILILFVALSRDFVAARTVDQSHYQLLGRVLRGMSTGLADVFIPIAWCSAAFLSSVAFLRTQLLPRWLAWWGLAAYPLPIISALLALVPVMYVSDQLRAAMMIPAAMQEVVLAIWLIAKGFNSSALISDGQDL